MDILNTNSKRVEAELEAQAKRSSDSSQKKGGQHSKAVCTKNIDENLSSLMENANIDQALQESVSKAGHEHQTNLNYRIESLSVSDNTSSSNKYNIYFPVPEESINMVSNRPVLACGAMFDIKPNHPNGVVVTVTSSDPDNTAKEIGKRLAIRVRGDSGTMNPCPLS